LTEYTKELQQEVKYIYGSVAVDYMRQRNVLLVGGILFARDGRMLMKCVPERPVVTCCMLRSKSIMLSVHGTVEDTTLVKLHLK
jgi:hypothetical protein